MLLNHDGLAFKLINHQVNGLLNSPAEKSAVRSGSHVFDTLADHGTGNNRSGCGTVSGDIVCLGGNFLQKLRAHIFKRILQLDLLGNGYTVIGDCRGAELFLQNHIASFGAECDPYCIRYFIHSALHSAACFFSKK